MRFLRSSSFWIPFFITFIVMAIFFAWELRMLPASIPAPSRPIPTGNELWFVATLTVLLAVNVGLYSWRTKAGSCPIGTKRATKIAGAMGALTLLCPVCILIPFSLLGVSISLVFLSPFLPLLQIISLVLLIVSLKLLWPTKV